MSTGAASLWKALCTVLCQTLYSMVSTVPVTFLAGGQEVGGKCLLVLRRFGKHCAQYCARHCTVLLAQCLLRFWLAVRKWEVSVYWCCLALEGTVHSTVPDIVQYGLHSACCVSGWRSGSGR